MPARAISEKGGRPQMCLSRWEVTDAPASDNILGAKSECKHAWLERRRQHLVFLVLKAD